MHMPSFIQTKRDGRPHDDADLRAFVDGIVSGDIPDYQTAAWLMDGFRRLGYPLRCGEQAAEAGASDCFATASPADLVDTLGQKRIGSAQYWRHGHLLQHGEILIEPPPQLWTELFGGPAPAPLPGLSRKHLIQALQTSLEERWDPLRWIDTPLTLDEGALTPYRLETRPT